MNLPKGLHTFDGLSNKNFRHVWIGQVGTGMGLWMDHITRGWLVYELTHSPLQLGLVGAARGVPLLIFGLLAGVVADRYSRKIQLTISAATDAACSLVLAMLIVTGRVEVWHVYVTGFVAGTSQAFSAPARMALLHDLVGKEKLMNSVALMSSAFNVSRGVGPAIAGIVIRFAGVAASYFVEAVLSGVAAYLTTRVQVPREAEDALHRQAKTQGSVYRSTADALKYVVSTRLMLALMALGLGPMVLAMPFTSLFPVFAVDILHVGSTGQGLLLSSLGIGAFISALGVASMKGGPMGKVMLGAAILFGVVLVVFAYSPWMWVSMIMTFIAGVSNTSFTTQNQTAIQMMAPDHMRGRVMGIYIMDRALTPIGSAMAGVLAALFGGPGAVMIMGLATIALAVAIALLVPEVAAMGLRQKTEVRGQKLEVRS